MKFLTRTGLLWVMLLSATLAVGQENGNRDSKNRIVRGPYETNRLGDNIFIGVAGGVNIYKGENSSYGSFGKRIAPAVDVYAGKWITPAVGFRVGYSGISARGWSVGLQNISPYIHKLVDPRTHAYETKFGVSYLHADFMLNFSDAVSGYKQTRRWNFIPFAGVGWARSFANDVFDNEIAFSIGLLNNVRLLDWLDLTIEARQMFANPRFDGVVIQGNGRGEGMFSATVGLAFKIGRTGFKRSRATAAALTTAPTDVAAYAKRIESLVADNSALTKQNQELAAKNEALRKSNAAAEAKATAANKAAAEAKAAAKSAAEKSAAAKRKDNHEQTDEADNDATVRYAVQIAASRRSVPITSPDFRSFSGKVKMYTSKGGIYPYKYCVHECDTMEEAQNYLPQAKKVFPRAFVVKCQGNRIVD